MDDKQYDRLLEFLIDVKRDQDEIKSIVIHNTVVLNEHMRRTEASEKRLEVVETALEPVTYHVKTMATMVKVGIGILGAAGTVAAIVEVIRNLHSI